MNEEIERFIVQETMIKSGGSFVKALGEAISHADSNNLRKIKTIFSDYWEQYLEMGILAQKIKKGVDKK